MKRKSGVCIVFLFLCVGSYSSSDYSIILKRNIFSAPPPVSPPQEIIKTPIIKPADLPDLNTLIELKGIAYFETGDSYALINIKKKNEEFVFRQGDIVENAELIDIEKNRVVFIYGDNKVYMELQKVEDGGFVEVAPGVSAKVDDPSFVSAPAEVSPVVPVFHEPVTVNFETTVKEIMKDTETLKNLNVSPAINDGKIEGFRVSNISPESLIYQYGFRDGDVLKRVNGVLIDSIAKGFAVYNQIARDKVKMVNVEVLRNNTPVVFTFALQ